MDRFGAKVSGSADTMLSVDPDLIKELHSGYRLISPQSAMAMARWCSNRQ